MAPDQSAEFGLMLNVLAELTASVSRPPGAWIHRRGPGRLRRPYARPFPNRYNPGRCHAESFNDDEGLRRRPS